MRSHLHGVVLATAAALALGLGASTARADDANRQTILTFDRPMAVPGATLPAGTYTFVLANPDSSRDVVNILRADGTPVASAGIKRVPRTGERGNLALEVALNGDGAAPVVKGWFYPGLKDGFAFVYPAAEARRLAAAETVDIAVTPRG